MRDRADGAADGATASGPASARLRGALKAAALALVAVLGAVSMLAMAPARAASLLEKNFWLSGPNFSADLPNCGEPAALELIASRFAETEKRFWQSDLAISSFERVGEIAFRPWSEENVPRRYCSGTIFTSDARKRAIYYSIIDSGSFIGATWGVEWCIVGLDRNYAYAPSCKMARP